MQSTLAIMRKEILHIMRDRRTLTMIVFMPLMQLLLYGYGINMDAKHLATVVFDEDGTAMSRRLVEAFVHSSYFDVHERVQDRAAMRRALDRGQAKVGLHIPAHFAQDLLAGRTAPLQLVIDGSDSNPANTALNTGQAITVAFMQQEGLAPAEVLPVDYRPRLWYNPDLKSSFFMVPGLVGLLLQLLIPMITAAAIVREKERGNIEQLLVTPIKPVELMMGKIIPYVGIGLVIATTVLSAAHFLFHVPIRGNLLTLYTLTLLFITVCLGMGLFASTVAENQQQASQFIMLFAAPSILLSGFIFPRETMPFPIYALGTIIPMTYYVRIIRGVVLKGSGWADLWPEILPLVFMAAGILYLSVRKFHKRMQ